MNDTEEKMYVLVFKERPQFTEQYFQHHLQQQDKTLLVNLYPNRAVLCSSLNQAKKMTLDEAEKNLNFMNEPEFWSIWSIKKGWVLDKRSERHIIRNEREKLEKKLKELEKLEENM
jgi:hypothetical protein